MLFGGLCLGLRFVHGAVGMLGRRVDGDEPQLARARVHEVVQRPGRNKNHVSGSDRGADAVQDRLTLAFDEKEDLIALVGLLADVLAGLESHGDDLAVLAGDDRLSEVLVPPGELGVVVYPGQGLSTLSEAPIDRGRVEPLDLDGFAPGGLPADYADMRPGHTEGLRQQLDQCLVRTSPFRRRRDPRLPTVAVTADQLAPRRARRDGDADPGQSSLTITCLICV
jgi:hypothetical protein